MKTSSKKYAMLGLGLAFLGSIAGAQADEKGSDRTYVLKDGTVHETPGAMFQHLRTRDELAAGNPKDIVNAYPDEFENVGDLIQQKRQPE